MDVLTEQPTAEAPRRHRRAPALVGAVVAVVAVVGGVLWLRQPDSQDDGVFEGASAAPQPDLHWVLDAPPGDTVAFGASDFYPAVYSLTWTAAGSFRTSMYGAADDPSAPAIVLGIGDELNMDGVAGMGAASTDMRRWTFGDDGTGLCGSDPSGMRRCLLWVDGRVIGAHATGWTDADLQRMLSSVRIDGGTPLLDESALPAGTSLLGTWKNQVPTPDAATDGSEPVSALSYLDRTGRRFVLTTGHAATHDIASAFELGATDATTVDGVTYYSGDLGPLAYRTVVWERDGRTFVLGAIGAPDDDLIALARGVRPASADEWAAAVSATPPAVDQMPAAPTTVAPPTTAAFAPAPATVTDVPVTVTAVDGEDGGGLVLTAALPDGSATPLTLFVVPGGQVPVLDGIADPYGLDDAGRPVVMAARSDTSWAAFVVTTEPSARQLRVTRSNGDRYVADLVPYPGQDGTWVAAIVVPRDEIVGAELVDEFGNRLDAFGLV